MPKRIVRDDSIGVCVRVAGATYRPWPAELPRPGVANILRIVDDTDSSYGTVGEPVNARPVPGQEIACWVSIPYGTTMPTPPRYAEKWIEQSYVLKAMTQFV